MSVLSTLKSAGGCAGGYSIYYAAKGSAYGVNFQRKERKLWPDTRAKMKHFFPDLDIGHVRFSINCRLPGNWFMSAGSVAGMTFGYRIFFKGTNVQKSWPGLELLMHELVHVDQVRRRGKDEGRFACDYGKGYLKGGSYEKNPMEAKAINFVGTHRLPDSLPPSLRTLPKKG